MACSSTLEEVAVPNQPGSYLVTTEITDILRVARKRALSGREVSWLESSGEKLATTVRN